MARSRRLSKQRSLLLGVRLRLSLLLLLLQDSLPVWIDLSMGCCLHLVGEVQAYCADLPIDLLDIITQSS